MFTNIETENFRATFDKAAGVYTIKAINADSKLLLKVKKLENPMIQSGHAVVTDIIETIKGLELSLDQLKAIK